MTGDVDNQEASRLAFIMPVVNPRNAKVSDYGTVLGVLRETIRSLCAQSHRDILIVVVGHGVPGWAGELDARVRFVDVDGHPAFAPNRNDVRVDKGMKYALGCLYAIGREHARLVMLTDADDFLRTDLGERLFALLPGTRECDGFLIRRGFELPVEPQGGQLLLRGAFEIGAFNRGCGSCRIFRAEALVAGLEGLDRGLMARAAEFSTAADGHAVRPARGLLDHVARLTDPIRDDDTGFIRVLGRHTRQAAHFRFAMLDEALAAKTCGHGQHDSRQGGDIVHWGRIARVADPHEVLAQFGLASSPAIRVEEDPTATRRARAWIAANRIRSALRGLLPPRRKY